MLPKRSPGDVDPVLLGLQGKKGRVKAIRLHGRRLLSAGNDALLAISLYLSYRTFSVLDGS
jgi:hypothetical protein